ncbi:hypothetical protein ABS767_12190 [Sphingomonas sp. ST-64]|uniref:Uncharacterized protein n=1 Tax=Sphingomonas plantiphila TaxID=3163295 RepID=A0ABW8YRC4_9SPHN
MAGPEESPERKRPEHYSVLLREPISLEKGQDSFDGWEFAHGARQRFYVDGMQWFARTSGIQRAQDLDRYGPLAAETIEHGMTWHQMPMSGNNWNDCSDIQFRRARNRHPMFFQKAALVILACELALADRIRVGRVNDKTVTALDVYSKMSIIPACWHIDDFDRAALKTLIESDEEALTKLRDAAAQTKKTFVEHMVVGHTVTLKTAKAVKKYLDENHPHLGVGAINARLSNGLGTKNATEFEHIDVT